MTNHPNRSRHADAQASPGPWRTTDNNIASIGIRAADGTAVCACRFQGPDGRTDHHSIGTAKANARLIAAAPELLAALKAVVRIADRRTVEFDAARVAIARAEGDNPATPAAVTVGDFSGCLSTICVTPDVCDETNTCVRQRLRMQRLTIIGAEG